MLYVCSLYITCHLYNTQTVPQEAVLVAPYDRRLPFIRVRTRVADRLMGQRFVVRVDSWERVSW